MPASSILRAFLYATYRLFFLNLADIGFLKCAACSCTTSQVKPIHAPCVPSAAAHEFVRVASLLVCVACGLSGECACLSEFTFPLFDWLEIFFSLLKVFSLLIIFLCICVYLRKHSCTSIKSRPPNPCISSRMYVAIFTSSVRFLSAM